MRFLGALLAFVLVALLACGTHSNAGVDSLAALESLGTRVPALAPMIAPRAGGLARVADSLAEDAESRGCIVSEGWRATKERRFTLIGAKLPDRADGALDVGASRFSSIHVHTTLSGASATSQAQVSSGRVVYRDALASTDRVIVANDTSLEEFLVLRDAGAPQVFTWNMQLSSDLARVTEHGGAYHFETARGDPKLILQKPTAYDANGATVPLAITWDDALHTLRVTLTPQGALAYPVVVDPKYDVSLWFDTSLLSPLTRSYHALAFDSTRGEIVLFGGLFNGSRLDDTWVWNGATARWTHRVPATRPPGRYQHALAFDSARGEIVLFGGYGATATLKDTWVWNGAAGTWTERTPSTAPSARAGHALAFDSARGEVVLYGGYDSAQALRDTWVWSGVAETWTQRLPTTSPPALSNHALAFDSARGEVVLFGGGGSAGVINDTWVWNGGATSWTQRTPSTAPPVRAYHALAFDSARGEVVLFGGQGFSGLPLGDTWVWNGASRSWTQRTPATPPSARQDDALAFDSVRGEVILFGGQSDAGDLNDTWAWNGATTAWTRRAPATPPPARDGHTLAFDSARSEVVLFGGYFSGGSLNDTWVWSGATSSWTKRTPTAAPPARSYHATAFDSARGEVVLFGGGSGSGNLSDTWVWNGASASWTRRLPTAQPSARVGHALAFDSTRGEVVLFGGCNGTTASAETWVWDGTAMSWTQRAPSTSPSARCNHALAFDSARGEVVLFGGLGFLNDTWVWNGGATSWTQRAPPTPPAGRQGHALAFDSTRGEVVLFGGIDTSARLNNDTWVWNGTAASWTARAPTTPPLSRWIHSLAFDSARGEVVLFGGSGSFALLNDTWLHRTLGGTCTTNADCLSSSSCVDGVCCNVASCGTCETCAGTSPGRCTPVTNREDADTCALAGGKSCSDLGECRAALGTVATKSADCVSGFIVDGVCCATATCPLCQTCSAALAQQQDVPGYCTASKSGTDPHDECVDDGATSCGHNGQCDGNRLCQLYASGTPCGPSGAVCGGAGQCIAQNAASCDGDHTVIAPDNTKTDCGAYKCEGSRCKTSCMSRTDCTQSADCTPDHVCTAYAATSGTSGGCNGCRVSGARANSRDAFYAAMLGLVTLGLRRRRGNRA